MIDVLEVNGFLDSEKHKKAKRCNHSYNASKFFKKGVKICKIQNCQVLAPLEWVWKLMTNCHLLFRDPILIVLNKIIHTSCPFVICIQY